MLDIVVATEYPELVVAAANPVEVDGDSLCKECEKAYLREDAESAAEKLIGLLKGVPLEVYE